MLFTKNKRKQNFEIFPGRLVPITMLSPPFLPFTPSLLKGCLLLLCPWSALPPLRPAIQSGLVPTAPQKQLLLFTGVWPHQEVST